MVLDRLRKRPAVVTSGAPPAPAAGLVNALPSVDQLVFDGVDPVVNAAVDTMLAGNSAPLANLLAETLAQRSWDRRSHAVSRAALAAAHAQGQGPAQVQAWVSGNTHSPHAALVAAQLHLQLAWAARSRRDADRISAQQADDFARMVAEALPMVAHALHFGPHDPVAYEVAIDHALAAGAPRETFYQLCQGAEAADPLHLGWHSAALRYLSPRWHGSADELWLYADAVSEAAPPAARVALLPALALSDVWRDDAQRHGSAGGPGRPFVLERIEHALARAHAHLPHAPHEPARLEAINVIAHLLGQVHRDAEAYGAFEAIGRQVTALPWGSYLDPIGAFEEFRQDAIHARAGRP